MSSSPSRDPLSGRIRQNNKFVGSICLPEEELAKFVEQFNRCYGPLQMRIDVPLVGQLSPQAVFPVGATRPAATELTPSIVKVVEPPEAPFDPMDPEVE